MGPARIAADHLGTAPREIVLTPDAAARSALAGRLHLPEITSLTCRFVLTAERAGAVLGLGELDAVVVQEDVTTLEPFSAIVHDTFSLRFMPEDALSDTIDPDDPIDEVGYAGGTIDLAEAMCEQLALALDPYPRRPD